ncbi:MAG TPA: hypothetical protein VI873_01160, partial [Candidatus Peribacteraceae bacterium]|nr:hypothetical protein [Candidatus Peribacteraceae bacterium]
AAPNTNSQNGLNRVVLGDILFNVHADNASLNAAGFYFFNPSDSTVKARCTAVDQDDVALTGTITGDFFVRCAFVDQSGVDTQIDSGNNATFYLQADVMNSKIVGSKTSTLQVSLQNFSDSALDFFSPRKSHLVWEDKDFSGTVHGFTWIDYPETIIYSTMYQS